MASLFTTVQGFIRQSNKSPNLQQQQQHQKAEKSNIHVPSPTFPKSDSPVVSPISNQMNSASSPMNQDLATGPTQQPIRKPQFFFRKEYAAFIVKGRFMTLAANPINVERGEWLAYLVVEQWQLLDTLLSIIKAFDENTGAPVCCSNTCPATAHNFTWLDTRKQPIKIAAQDYIKLVQRWINGKIDDPRLFPTVSLRETATYTPGDNTSFVSNGFSSAAAAAAGLIITGTGFSNSTDSNLAGPTNGASHPSEQDAHQQAPNPKSTEKDWLGKASGFPESFEQDIRNIYRQMMRCYTHIYHAHWLGPFWHNNAYEALNTCFIHFINVGRLYMLIREKDMEPMQPLIDLWIRQNWLPALQTADPAPSSKMVID